MRMLLTSNGALEEPVRSRLLDLMDRPLAESRSAVVIDAMLPFPGDKTRLIEDLGAWHDLGWAGCDVMSLLAGPVAGIEQRLRAADVIVGYGGTNHWLAHVWRVTGLAPTVLRALLEEKVYVGVSAGSMIFSRAHAAAVHALDDQAEVDMLGLDEVGPALPLFDWFPLTHLGAPYFPDSSDEWAAGVARRLGAPLWCVEDGSALLVTDPEADPEVISSGHWLRFDADGRLVDRR